MIARFDAWLDAGHVRTVVRLLLIAQVLGFVFMVAGTHGAFAPEPMPPTTTDFASFYAAGMLANDGHPGSAYDAAAHRAAEAGAIAPGVEEKRFLYPPVFLLLCAPLARLPYLPAFVLFEASTFAVWLTLTTRIAGGGALASLALCCVPSVWWALGWGQNSFLSASLMGAGTILLRRRPLLAGAAFGALCFKPHFAVLVPVALLVGRHWRAVAGAGLSAAALVGLSAACFGVAAWRSFLHMAQHARATIETGIQLAGHADPGGFFRLLGATPSTSWLVQACFSAAAALCVGWLWHWAREQPNSASRQDLANAGLICGTLTAMPFVLFYDLVMAGVAAAWLARAARRRDWRAGERATLALLAVLDLLAYPSAALLHVASGAVVGPALLYLVVRRAAGEQASVEPHARNPMVGLGADIGS